MRRWFLLVPIALLLVQAQVAPAVTEELADPSGVEGIVTAVEETAQLFLVLRGDGATERFRLTPATVVLQGGERLHGPQLVPGQRVRVHAAPGVEPRTAEVVEILALTPDPNEPAGSGP